MNTLTAICGDKQTDYLCKVAANHLNDNKSVIYISTPTAINYTKGCISSKLKPDCSSKLFLFDEYSSPLLGAYSSNVVERINQKYNNIHFGCMIFDVYETFDNLSRGMYGLSRIKQSLIDMREFGKDNEMDIYVRSPHGQFEDIATFIKPNVDSILTVAENELTRKYNKVMVEEWKWKYTKADRELYLEDLK